MPRAFELAAARPWLMLPDALDSLMAIADRQGDPEALEARLGKPLDNARAVTLRDGVAVIPVTGPIMRYANLFTRISGATSTQELATDLQAALDDPKVRAIVLNVDSPGGEATGINELADMVHAARGKKPIKAYVGGTGASAAYWIASAADEVVVDDTALLGSIGVVVEVAVRKEADGIKRYTITSSNAPNKRPDLDTEQGRAEIAKSIDALAEVFVAKVARNLKADPADVPAMGDFGGLKVGADAVAAGLAHRLGSLESLIAELASPAATQRKPSMTIVRTTAELQAAIAAGTDPQTLQIAAAEPVDLDAVKAEAGASAAKAERERITGIHALAAKGFEKEIAAAIEEGRSVEATALSLFKAAQDRGIGLAGIKADATGTTGANPPQGDQAAAERKTAVNAIVAGARR
ncbi:S49 family peptidase [Azotobacter beijerinckii]|uniref:Serine protease, ClpP class n=2 Tax=Azotobacter beijerinckii TaxID=170623 RepID=A0A1I1BFR8_9GAMM|nr:S49 family peptidase [Azotobacter beijerinckii]SFB48496.1 serine protease, ClpP class [Azotobacter beijerinckii]